MPVEYTQKAHEDLFRFPPREQVEIRKGIAHFARRGRRGAPGRPRQHEPSSIPVGRPDIEVIASWRRARTLVVLSVQRRGMGP